MLEATQRIIEALQQFARQRQATVIPALQRQLVETFVDRTPDEIAKLLGRETAREREFLKRQARRMERDLPKVLAEADVEARKAAMAKLMAREQRYMAQREQAMTARAHSVVESLALQEASPEGAFWKLGGAIHHTPGCIAMSGKFWPWEVLREVAIPPVHPGCACQLIGLHEAGHHGLIAPHHLPDVKDALARARRYMALEEAFEDEVSEEGMRVALVFEVLEEAQRRYAKGTEHGGEFLPKLGGDFAAAKGALGKLLTKRGASRRVWIKGNQVDVPHDRQFAREFDGTLFTSPPHSTNVYREDKLVAPEGEPSTHPDVSVKPPKGERAATPKLPDPLATPKAVPAAEKASVDLIREQIKGRMESGKQQPVDVGLPANSTHLALVKSGWEVGGSGAGKTKLNVNYRQDGHKLSVDYGRKSGKVEMVVWKPPTIGSPAWKPKGGGKGGKGGKFPGEGHTGAQPSLFSKPSGPPPKPIAPTVHPALTTDYHDRAKLFYPNFDHVALTVPAHSNTAKDEEGNAYVLHQSSRDHVASALLASAVYRELGVPVPLLGVRHLPEPHFGSIPDVDLGEQPIETGGKRASSGIILRHPNGDVTIFEPRNHFGGYQHTFPKGGVEAGLTPQQNAHKELWEETGLHARITGLVGDYAGDTSVSRYYTGVLTGGEPTAGPETEAVKTVSPEEAATLLNKERDKQILADVLEHPAPSSEPGPDTFPLDISQPALLSPRVGGTTTSYIAKPTGKLGQHFMADALLGNWDVMGKNDAHIRWDEKGIPIRTSVSGSLGYRTSGDEKPFGPVPHEVWSMLGPKGEAHGKMAVTEQERRDQAGAIAKALPPEKIDTLVDAMPFGPTSDVRETTRDALKARVEWMGAYSRGEVHEPEPLQGPAAAAELTASQEGIDLFPEQHAALALYPEEMDAIEAHFQAGGSKSNAPTEDQNLIIKELDSVLRFVRTEDDITAYMGIDAAALLGDNPDKSPSIVGKTLSARGYVNLSLAEGEARKQSGVFQVTVPTGSHAIYTRGIAGVDPGDVDPRTPDVIAERNSRMRVVGQEERDGKTYFEVVLL